MIAVTFDPSVIPPAPKRQGGSGKVVPLRPSGRRPGKPTLTASALTFRQTRTDTRPTCLTCGQPEGECAQVLHELADLERRERLDEEARKRRLDAEALADALTRRQAAPPDGVALTSELFEQWNREMRGECSEAGGRRAATTSLTSRSTSGRIAGMMEETKRKTYPASCLARASRETFTKEKGSFAALARWLESQGWGFVACELPKVSTKQRGTRDARRKLVPVPMKPPRGRGASSGTCPRRRRSGGARAIRGVRFATRFSSSGTRR